MTAAQIRAACRRYAQKFVDLQSKDFQRLGIFGRWNKPYLTMSAQYEAVIARAFVQFLENGFIYKGLKPVNWCPNDRTALAEAEVEYEQHRSPSIYVRFALESDPAAISPALTGQRVYALIWITTPWTIPANMAISYNPRFTYAAVLVGNDVYIVAEGLLAETAARCNWESYNVITRFEGDTSDLREELRREGIPSDEASYYVDGLSAGGALVSVRADEAETDTAVEIMNRYANSGGDVDYDTTPDMTTGMSAGTLDTDLTTDANTVDYDTARPVTTDVTDASTRASAATGDEARLEVVEEQLRIGKRSVDRGGVRVRRYVTETPVEEQVTLRDETINVDRRRVDRTVGSADGDLFTEQTFEFTETDEEAVVAKEAHVVEEVVVGKSVEERTETVRDTVRRTDVEIEQLGTAYGETMSSDARYSGREWVDVENEVRVDWERDNQGQGTWDEVKDSVRNSWERSRGR